MEFPEETQLLSSDEAAGNDTTGTINMGEGFVDASAAVKSYCAEVAKTLSSEKLRCMRDTQYTFTIPPPNPYLYALRKAGPANEFETAPFHQPVIEVVDPTTFFGVPLLCPNRGWDHASYTRPRGNSWVFRYVRQPGRAGIDELKALCTKPGVCTACAREKLLRSAEAQAALDRGDDGAEELMSAAKNLTYCFRAWDPRVMQYYRENASTYFIAECVYNYSISHKTAMPAHAVREIVSLAVSTLSANALATHWKRMGAMERAVHVTGCYSAQLFMPVNTAGK